MKKKGTALGNLSSLFFAYMQLKNKEIARTGELAPVLNITESQEYDLLRRLAKSGWIIRLKRGVYLIPTRFPAGGKFNPGPAVILDKLMQEYGGRYQITGPTACNFYGFDNQVANIFFLYNNRISGKRTIGHHTFQFIKTNDNRLGSVSEFATPQGVNLVYSSKARTLVDAVYDWSKFHSLPRGYMWIRKEVNANRKFVNNLVDNTVRYGNQATLRRVGYLLNSLDIPQKSLKIILANLHESKSFIPWIPNREARGTLNRKWGVIVNDS